MNYFSKIAVTLLLSTALFTSLNASERGRGIEGRPSRHAPEAPSTPQQQGLDRLFARRADEAIRNELAAWVRMNQEWDHAREEELAVRNNIPQVNFATIEATNNIDFDLYDAMDTTALMFDNYNRANRHGRARLISNIRNRLHNIFDQLSAENAETFVDTLSSALPITNFQIIESVLAEQARRYRDLRNRERILNELRENKQDQPPKPDNDGAAA